MHGAMATVQQISASQTSVRAITVIGEAIALVSAQVELQTRATDAVCVTHAQECAFAIVVSRVKTAQTLDVHARYRSI
eukprot:m.141456 g.141456  ORF g.141456 m.141456 type:complete len:78 (-) comp15980_c0_seq3:142-375(-)